MAMHGGEEEVPEGWNPDDWYDYQDELHFWRQELAGIDEVLEQTRSLTAPSSLNAQPKSGTTATFSGSLVSQELPEQQNVAQPKAKAISGTPVRRPIPASRVQQRGRP